MRVYRITAAEHAAAPLSGHGAAISGGRWNSPGTRIGYTTAFFVAMNKEKAAEYRKKAANENL